MSFLFWARTTSVFSSCSSFCLSSSSSSARSTLRILSCSRMIGLLARAWASSICSSSLAIYSLRCFSSSFLLFTLVVSSSTLAFSSAILSTSLLAMRIALLTLYAFSQISVIFCLHCLSVLTSFSYDDLRVLYFYWYFSLNARKFT